MVQHHHMQPLTTAEYQTCIFNKQPLRYLYHPWAGLGEPLTDALISIKDFRQFSNLFSALSACLTTYALHSYFFIMNGWSLFFLPALPSTPWVTGQWISCEKFWSDTQLVATICTREHLFTSVQGTPAFMCSSFCLKTLSVESMFTRFSDTFDSVVHYKTSTCNGRHPLFPL